MRKTKIICTIGPASEKPEVLESLLEKGTNVIRLNLSHGGHEEHERRIKLIKEIRETLGIPAPILIDTKGPEIRIGKFNDGQAQLIEGQDFILTTKDIIGDATKVSISYKGITNDIRRGTKILLDDGLIELVAADIEEDVVHCKVINGGIIGNQKGVNIPGVSIGLPAITQKDIEDIKFGIAQEIDYIAASFVRKPSDVLEIRRILEENNGNDIKIIAKIENHEGIENFDDIVKVADGIMVARGDLGVEIPTEDVPVVQKRIISKCIESGKPVITATQMLDSMIRNPRPTRAEANDVANAIYDGTDAIMLSGETAAGKYPVDSLLTMVRIAERVENSIDYKSAFENRTVGSEVTVTNSISHAICVIAHDLGASAIVTATKSGYTARMVSKYRPESPIIATTTSERTYRELALLWGVCPYISPQMDNTDEMIEKSVQIATETDIVKSGDVIVVTGGIPVGISGTTNMIKVHIVGDILVKGTGMGSRSVYGKVCIVGNIMDARMKFKEGDILVARSTDNSLLPFIKRAGGIITEEGGVTSHAAIAGLSLEIPTIVGAQEATEVLTDGLCVTIDPVRGFIYNGKAKVI